MHACCCKLPELEHDPIPAFHESTMSGEQNLHIGAKALERLHFTLES
jgi:hypothetical protein